MDRADTIDVNGWTIHFVERGEGEPLVLLRGFTGSSGDWQHVFPSGAVEGFRTLAVDVRGHGRSTNPSKAFMFRQAARDVFALLDDMAFTRPLLATIAARTLIVHGDRDPYYPVELAVEMYRSIPKSALWVVPNGDHGPIFGPLAARFRDAVRAFLQGE